MHSRINTRNFNPVRYNFNPEISHPQISDPSPEEQGRRFEGAWIANTPCLPNAYIIHGSSTSGPWSQGKTDTTLRSRISFRIEYIQICGAKILLIQKVRSRLVVSNLQPFFKFRSNGRR